MFQKYDYAVSLYTLSIAFVVGKAFTWQFRPLPKRQPGHGSADFTKTTLQALDKLRYALDVWAQLSVQTGVQQRAFSEFQSLAMRTSYLTEASTGKQSRFLFYPSHTIDWTNDCSLLMTSVSCQGSPVLSNSASCSRSRFGNTFKASSPSRRHCLWLQAVQQRHLIMTEKLLPDKPNLV